MQSYFDGPKSLDELRDAVREPKRGYDIHHIVEKASARAYGYPTELIDAPEYLVRIPRYKHWEINAWYEIPNQDLGGMSPREYLKDKTWDEKERLGRFVLEKYGVLKP